MMAEDDRTLRSGLTPIDQTDLQVTHGNPDVRGWQVFSADGQRLGKVDDLLVDTDAKQVRYLDCCLDKQNRHVAVPIERARMEASDKKVIVPVNFSDAGTLPSYDSTRREIEGDRDYRMTRAEEELAIGKRDIEAGEVDVRKRVETEHVREPVTVRHEEVDVQRRPLTGASTGDDSFREEEIRIPIREEEVIVEKRPVVKEELVVRKRGVDETRVIDETVRKERIDVERHGKADRNDRSKRDR